MSTPDDGWRRPSSRLWTARLTVLGTLTLLGFLVGAGLSFASVVAGVVVAAVAVVLGLWSLWVAWRRYRAWGYAERDEDLLVRRGVMWKRVTVVPYGRMQLVELEAGPVDRLFGLATVTLHTAAAATDAKIPGVAQAEAERLRDQLARLGEAHAMGL